jgi:hypothetical protein
MRHRITGSLLVVAAALSACGSKSDAVVSTQAAAYVGPNAASSASVASSAAPRCVTAADVKSALGFDVRALTQGMKQYGPMASCGFAASDESALPGVTIQITVEPESEAEGRFADMRETVTTARGTPTNPDPITVGQRGMAYRTSSRTMAAAVSNGRLYTVDVRYGAVGKFGDKQAGVVEILRKLVAG